MKIKFAFSILIMCLLAICSAHTQNMTSINKGNSLTEFQQVAMWKVTSNIVHYNDELQPVKNYRIAISTITHEMLTDGQKKWIEITTVTPISKNSTKYQLTFGSSIASGVMWYQTANGQMVLQNYWYDDNKKSITICNSAFKIGKYTYYENGYEPDNQSNIVTSAKKQ